LTEEQIIAIPREQEAVRQKLAQWYWCEVFGELYVGAIETRFSKDLADVLAWIDGGPEPTTVKDSAFRPERLKMVTSRLSAACKGVPALLMHKQARDFLSGQSYNQASYFDETVVIHHIVPRARRQKNGIARERYDTIISKTPLSSKTNRIVRGDAPSIFLARLSKQGTASDTAIDTHIESHLIDPLLLQFDDFDGFIAGRQEALPGLIEAATGNAIYRGVATDERVEDTIEHDD
jgi:hypothetical protein